MTGTPAGRDKIIANERAACLGQGGDLEQITQVLHMLQGRWKLAILFRLYADPSTRPSQLRRELPGMSQKVLTQHLRQLQVDGLVERLDLAERRPHVEYRLSDYGRRLTPLPSAAKNLSIQSLGDEEP